MGLDTVVSWVRGNATRGEMGGRICITMVEEVQVVGGEQTHSLLPLELFILECQISDLLLRLCEKLTIFQLCQCHLRLGTYLFNTRLPPSGRSRCAGWTPYFVGISWDER